MTTETTVGQRLKELIKHYRVTQDALAQRIGLSKSYVSVVITDKEPLTTSFIQGLKKSFTRLNLNWLLYGEGEMLLGSMEKGGSPTLPVGAEPSMEDVERLRTEVLEKYKPDPPLNVKQDLTLRQACYKTIMDNPGQPWSALVVGAGVYLRFIEAYPNLQIPEAPGA